jgi:hypothetical protein
VSDQTHQVIVEFVIDKIKEDAAKAVYERQCKADPYNPHEIPQDILNYWLKDEQGKAAKRMLREYGLHTPIGKAVLERFDLQLRRKHAIFPRQWMYKYKYSMELIRIPTFMDYINTVHDSNRDFKKDSLEAMLAPLIDFCTTEVYERHEKFGTLKWCLSLHVANMDHDKWVARQIGCHPRTVRNYRRALIKVGLYQVVGEFNNFKPGHNPVIYADGTHKYIRERWIKSSFITEESRHKLADLRLHIKGFGHSGNSKKKLKR